MIDKKLGGVETFISYARMIKNATNLIIKVYKCDKLGLNETFTYYRDIL